MNRSTQDMELHNEKGEMIRSREEEQGAVELPLTQQNVKLQDKR